MSWPKRTWDDFVPILLVVGACILIVATLARALLDIMR
jgi:hypothetical protein